MPRRVSLVSLAISCTVLAVGLSAGSASARTASTPSAIVDRSVVHHRVRPSQSLSQIARLYGVTVNDVAAANGIRDPNVVPVGVVLTVPVTLYGPRHLPTTLRRSLDRVRLLPAFESAARQCGVPVDLLESMAWMESGWQNSVVSATGAIGVGQLMPGTARLMAARLGDSRLDPRRPADNIRMSACYLRFLLDRYNGDHRLALMAYNQGWGSLDTVGATPGARRYAMVIENQRSQFLPGG